MKKPTEPGRPGRCAAAPQVGQYYAGSVCTIWLVQLLNPVDPQGEGRRGLEVGLMIVAIEDCLIGIGREVAVRIRGKGSGDMAFCVDLERSGLAFLIGAQAGEFGDIEGMDREP